LFRKIKRGLKERTLLLEPFFKERTNIISDLALTDVQRRERFYQLGVETRELDPVFALIMFLKSGKKKEINELSEICLTQGETTSALMGFEATQNKGGILKGIQDRNLDNLILRGSLMNYIGRTLLKKEGKMFRKWKKEKGFNQRTGQFMPPVINMVYNLKDNYDLGISVAKGGLYLGFVFDLFGLPMKVVECHKRKSYFKEIDKIIREDVEGKKILVLEDDINTGVTSKEIFCKINENNPLFVDISFAHDKPFTLEEDTSVLLIPMGYRKAYSPNFFNYEKFDGAVELWKKGLKTKV